MTIYIPLAIIGIVITAFMFAKVNADKQRRLQAILDEQAKGPKLLLSTFNRREERVTKIFEKNGNLVVDTDLQIIQLTEDGNLQLTFSSDYNGQEIRGEMWTAIDPSILSFAAVEHKTDDLPFVLPYKDERTEKLLAFLKHEFDINYNIDMDLPATSVKVNDVKSGRSSEFTIYGEFKDNGKWQVHVNCEQFRLTITASLSSLQTISNFQKFYY